MKFGRSEDLEALRTGLREAFDFFGAVPEHVLFDNPKTVAIDRDAYGEDLHCWNEGLRQLAEECGFKPRLCRPYRAKTKGARSSGSTVTFKAASWYRWQPACRPPA